MGRGFDHFRSEGAKLSLLFSIVFAIFAILQAVRAVTGLRVTVGQTSIHSMGKLGSLRLGFTRQPFGLADI